MMIDQVDPHVHTALLILRIVLATTIIIHGWSKFWSPGGIKGTAKWFEEIGMRPGLFHARLAGISEIVFGYLLAFGLFSSFASAGIVALMVVACWVAHRGKGFLIVQDGWEYTAIIATVATTFSMIGPGRSSLDYAIGIHEIFDGWYGLVISAGGGVVVGSAVLAAFYRPSAAKGAAAAGGEDDGESSPEEESATAAISPADSQALTSEKPSESATAKERDGAKQGAAD